MRHALVRVGRPRVPQHLYRPIQAISLNPPTKVDGSCAAVDGLEGFGDAEVHQARRRHGQPRGRGRPHRGNGRFQRPTARTHEQPQMRRKWEDHDTNRGGLEWTNRGPRGSYAPRRGTLARAMLTRDSSYVNTRLTPPGQYTSNDKPVPRTLEPHAGLWPQTHWFTAPPAPT